MVENKESANPPRKKKSPHGKSTVGKVGHQKFFRCNRDAFRNDALGYFLWARCQLALAGKMPFTGDHLKLCGSWV